MILRDEKLRKVSDGIFQEAEPPEDRSRPLEWRRSFNFVNLPLKNIRIITGCSVHETEFCWEAEKSVNPLKLVKPNISDNIAITGTLDEDQMRDRIYCAVESKEEEGLFSVERVAGLQKVTLKAGKPSEESEKMPAGLYWGSAFRLNFDPGEDDLCFELCIPKDQMLSLIAAIRADENATTEVRANLLSFTFEVDDALREHYHSRDIVINDLTPCFVSWVGVTSKIGNHSVQSESENEDRVALPMPWDEADHPHDEEQITPEQRSYQELLQVLLSYSKPLNNLVTALWVLIVVIAMYAFFK